MKLLDTLELIVSQVNVGKSDLLLTMTDFWILRLRNDSLWDSYHPLKSSPSD